MTLDRSLDVEFCRRHFPLLGDDWIFMENAGGTLVPTQVIERVASFMTECQVQPGEGYPASEAAKRRLDEGRAVLAALINADLDAMIVGPSTTANVYVLSKALRGLLSPGDEVIVTNQDHEANNGAWRKLAADGIVVREWRMSTVSDDLEIADLEALLSPRTRLVCVTHCSNIVGLVHDVKAIAALVHAAGALICVDGVAFAPHRRVDVKDLDVDFYLYSTYKVFGPHLGVLYGRRALLQQLANQSHYFLDEDDFQRRLCPGGLNYELTAGAAGIGAYLDRVHEHHYPGANVDRHQRLDRVFELFVAHEQALIGRVQDYLATKPGMRLIGGGAAGPRERVGVFAFTVDGRDSRDVVARLQAQRIGVHADDFYAARCIDALGARPQGGVVRLSMVHYSSSEDLDRVLEGLERTL
jgi:cysteine desulfurase family protein (TIGR01976 family)